MYNATGHEILNQHFIASFQQSRHLKAAMKTKRICMHNNSQCTSTTYLLINLNLCVA